MNTAINFSSGFTHGIGWHWPIAVYLLLAGISGGCLILALGIRYFKNQKQNTPLYKSAAIISCISILLGMVFLVGDLARPLLFWKILIYYNFYSVMSIGVLSLLFYIPLTCLLVVFAYESLIKKYLPKQLYFLLPVLEWLKNFRALLESVSFVLSVVICAYTGFLISILVRFPLLNTSILPALFVVSGLSVGLAALSLVGRYFFKLDIHTGELHLLHKLEFPIMAIEILMLLMLYTSLLVGGSDGKVAIQAFSSGVWAYVFWLLIVGVGFILPLALNFAFGKKIANSLQSFYISGFASFVGVFSLRLFLLYAGQIFSV